MTPESSHDKAFVPATFVYSDATAGAGFPIGARRGGARTPGRHVIIIIIMRRQHVHNDRCEWLVR